MTDWNQECDLRIEYVNWLVDNHLLPCQRIIRIDLSGITFDPETILRYFRETGVLYYRSADSEPAVVTRYSYEVWFEKYKLVA